MESSEENIKLRSITGGCLHKRSFVFHIEHDGIFTMVKPVFRKNIVFELTSTIVRVKFGYGITGL